MTTLDVRDMTVEREGLPIVRDVSISVEAGTINVLLGMNGAGKTTLLEGISGSIEPAKGEVSLDGSRIDRLPPFLRARRGLAHVEQGRSVFDELTALENLLVASGSRHVDEVFGIFPELARRKHVVSSRLSGGEQQMLVLARAFLRRPRVLLIDEMSLGLAPMALRRLMTSVTRLRDTGLAILIVEQFATLALAAGHRATVLRGGAVVHEGTCAHLRDNEDLLRDLYLGTAGDPAGPTGSRP